MLQTVEREIYDLFLFKHRPWWMYEYYFWRFSNVYLVNSVKRRTVNTMCLFYKCFTIDRNRLIIVITQLLSLFSLCDSRILKEHSIEFSNFLSLSWHVFFKFSNLAGQIKQAIVSNNINIFARKKKLFLGILLDAVDYVGLSSLYVFIVFRKVNRNKFCVSK